MKNQYNWQKIKQALKENFIEPDFTQYSTTAFAGIDFDKGLEIFRYVLEQELQNHDKSKGVFEALQLYTDKDKFEEVLDNLSTKYEPFTKKILELLNIPYTPKRNNNPMPPALSWCYENLFSKQPSDVPAQSVKNFKAFTLNGKISKPNFSSNFFKANFLTDNTHYGKHLHRTYHFRNSEIHNDPNVNVNDTLDYVKDYITSYLYFTFKYYNELLVVIPNADLTQPPTVLIRDLASLSGGAFNPNIENEVKRDNIIQTIDNKIQKFDVLFIVGEEGIGKTTILHQFIAKHPNNCFSYFIDGKDSNTYSNLAILKALCNQIHFINNNDELQDDTSVDNFNNEDWLTNYFRSEVKRIKNKFSHTYYFIVDGFDELSQDKQNELNNLIINSLPYEKTNFKLIYGGRHNKKIVKQGCRQDNFDITLLSEEESQAIFGASVTKEQFEIINNVCKNNAGRIVFFRDLIKKGEIKIDNIIDKLPSDLSSIYQYLWDNTNFIQNSKIILAIIAFLDGKYDEKDIAKILNLKENQVFDALQFIPFVKKNSRGTYEYIFDGFINFAKTKLNNYKNKIDKTFIDYLLSDFDSINSMVRLPEMYKKTGNKDDLMELLSNEKWKQLLVKSEKISTVSRVSNVTLEAIHYENDNKYIPTILKYSVLKSALKELSRTTVWQYEIAASLVLKDYMDAQNLANIAYLKEDRLKMLASIARAYAERNEQVPENILRSIHELYDDIDTYKDFKNIKESAVQIASLLMYSIPKLAFRLIEDLSGTISDNDNAFDWALAQMSLSIHSNLENLEDVSKEDVDSKVYSKIRNPKIKEFADAILYLSENQTAEQIIERIKQLESTSQKMFLIRNWIGNNYRGESVAQIIELGLKLVVEQSDKYVPKSNDYKIFAMPLPYIKSKDKAYHLIKNIEQYTASIESSSGDN